MAALLKNRASDAIREDKIAILMSYLALTVFFLCAIVLEKLEGACKMDAYVSVLSSKSIDKLERLAMSVRETADLLAVMRGAFENRDYTPIPETSAGAIAAVEDLANRLGEEIQKIVEEAVSIKLNVNI